MNRISFRLGGVAVGLLLLVAACQEGNRIGVLNECGEGVEVRGSTLSTDGGSMMWVEIESGSNAEVVGTSEDAERLFLAVRTESIPSARVFVLSISSLGEPLSGDADYDIEVVLGGTTCSPTIG